MNGPQVEPVQSAPHDVALVLSGGGMFGAYQAGAWQALSEIVRPSLVVGTSVGSLNGWLIAGGVPPEEIGRRWLTLPGAAQHRWRFPRSWRDGIIDVTHFEGWIQEICTNVPLQTPFAAVLTETKRLRPIVFQDQQITWEHLAASCGVIGFLPQRRLDGVTYSDGGLISVLPLWAAEQLGAKRIIAINLMPPLPRPMQWAMRQVKRRVIPVRQQKANLVVIEPATPLGLGREAIYWSEDAVRRWMERGYQDALAARSQVVSLLAS